MAVNLGFAVVAASTSHYNIPKIPFTHHIKSSSSASPITTKPFPASLSLSRRRFSVLSCLPPPPPPSTFRPKTKLYVSGLSFRTTEESLRNAFQNFGQLLEVNLVMDKIANRPRGFAFLRYATEEESQKAIEGMHGKFLDGRVIFVEIAKPRSELRRGTVKQNSRQQFA
ncbi:organelle RRM domain-containing protein 6, chloroplastic [Mangifera indica]|uniref:organelle RRM domain-containing protein 6, chloroplastic n=1 Tax=Mangifera indica TaxID=29780 RepID=UPI001CFBD3DB|nr:organelle RRM domain-containing protein 6, chloroplastic [Mangifera indica]